MLQVILNKDFDLGYWPGPLHNREVSTGVAWVGPAGFINLLEPRLGLKGPVNPDTVRAAALVTDVLSADGFWSESAQTDPFGVARKLLRMRDKLWLEGWQGQGLTPRLVQLAQVTRSALPGFPDRVSAVRDAVHSRLNGGIELKIYGSVQTWPKLWRDVFTGLELVDGWSIELTTPFARSKGDLLAARRKGFKPKGDGSLQLLRASGPMTAARHAAAWLANQDNLEETVIIGPDALLDQALRDFGLPTTGGTDQVDRNSLLQILPLTLDLMDLPPDPQRALELLTLPISPVPGSLARQLIMALQEWPAVGSEEWQRRLKEWLDDKRTGADRERLAKRLGLLFDSGAERELIPVTEIRLRTRMLTDWLRGLIRFRDGEEVQDLQTAQTQIEDFDRLLDLSRLKELTRPQIKRLVKEASHQIPSEPRYPAQAGIAAVGSPGCLVETARRVVWWNFNSGTAPAIERPDFYPDEIQALAKAGIILPSPGDQAVEASRSWRRPLVVTEKSLLCVCPFHGPDGEELHPHPLWDELAGNLAEGANLSILEVPTPLGVKQARQAERPRHELPKPVTELHVSVDALTRLRAKRTRESANSLARLAACPFGWVIQYLAGVWPGGGASIDEGDRIQGRLAHEVLTRMLLTRPANPRQAGVRAGELFDELGPMLAGRIFLPGQEEARDNIRLNIIWAAEETIRAIQKTGLEVKAVEEEQVFNSSVLKSEIYGRPDVILGDDQAIIDFKSGGSSYRSKELERGGAVQLAIYARILKGDGGDFPAGAFFSIKDRRLVTTDGLTFSDDQAAQGPSLEETWNGLVRAVRGRFLEMDEGRIRITGNSEDCPAESCLEDGCLSLAPTCRWCDLDCLCGQFFGGER